MKESILKSFKKYNHAWVFSYSILYLIWYQYLENTVTTRFNIIHSPYDDMIPFIEYFIIPYLYWFIYLTFVTVFLFFKNKDEFYRFMFYLCVGMSTCLLICQIYPNGTDLRPACDFNKNWAAGLVHFIYSVDTNTNVFPSIHVYNSIGAHIAITKSRYFKGNIPVNIFSLISCVSICASTVFLKQHSILDVCAAIILGTVMYFVVYGKVQVPEKLPGIAKKTKRKSTKI